MSRSDEERLGDIRRMCEVIAEIVSRGRAAYDADQTLGLALERAVEVAGEAATRVSEQTTASFPLVAWGELRAVRVLLAHAYHRVDADQLWSIAAHDFPDVARALDSTAGR